MNRFLERLRSLGDERRRLPMQESAKDKNSVSQISKTCITFCIKIPSKEVQTIPKIYIKQKKRQTFVSLSSFLLSTPAEARTLDTLIKSQVLYQLSYGCIIFSASFSALTELRVQRYGVFLKPPNFFLFFFDFHQNFLLRSYISDKIYYLCTQNTSIE